MVTSDLRQRFQWFLPRIGGIVGQRAQSALALARAERWAESEELETVWQSDPETDLGDHAYWCLNARALDRLGARRASEHGIYRCEHETESAALIRPCEDHGIECRHAEYLATLGGIIDADRDYRRIVSAELALEAMP